MENNLIAVTEICTYHHVEAKFIQSLEDFGLLHTTEVRKVVYLKSEELSKLEQFLRLSNDLNINIEGLHAVSHLLSQLDKLQVEMTSLKNELNYYRQMH